ncbi:hypothetical protein [Streptomyces sp. NPDC002845]
MVQVLIAHTEGEEHLAEAIAMPLARAGYKVVHGGTVLVGESIPEQTSQALLRGSPIVLCGTAATIGNAWTHRLVQAARGYSGVRIFGVQMEKDAYLEILTLDGKIALYWQDPAKAMAELIDALAEYY